MSVNKHIKETAQKKGDLYRSKPNYPRTKLQLCLGLPQSINHMYHNTRGGGRCLTRTAKDYIRDSRAKVNLAIEEVMWEDTPQAVWYYLDAIVYMPDRRVRDSHNMLKLLLDTLEGVCYTNDYYVMPRIQAVEYDKDNPRIELILKPQTAAKRNQMLKEFKDIAN